MIFNKGRNPWEEAESDRDNHVLFIDASDGYEDGARQNRLRDEDIERIVTVFKNIAEMERYSHRATLEEIREADFNLNIPRLVDTFEEDEEIDIPVVEQEIAAIEAELAELHGEMAVYLRELGLE